MGRLSELKNGDVVMVVKAKDLSEDHGCIYIVQSKDSTSNGRVIAVSADYRLLVWPKFLLVFPPLDDLLDATDEMVRRVGPAPRI